MLKNIISLLMAISFSMFSRYCMIEDARIETMITILVSFVTSFWCVRKTIDEWIEYYKKEKAGIAISVILAMIVIGNKGVVAVPALAYLFSWLYMKILPVALGLWESVEAEQKNIYKKMTIMLSLVVVVLYCLDNRWYLQMDHVYSMDSRWVFEEIFPQALYYDIRHPALSIITFPIWAIISALAELLAPTQLAELITACGIQFLNIQCLLITGLIIGKLSKSKWTQLLYYCSMPTLLFGIFFEKYQICVFLLAVYTYIVCETTKDSSESIILATGTMPTSAFIFVAELLNKESLVKKVQRIAKVFLKGILFIICFGRIHMLNIGKTLAELSEMTSSFGGTELELAEKINGFNNMVQGSFIALSSSHKSGLFTAPVVYFWDNILTESSIVSVVMIGLMILGLVIGWKEKFAKVCGVWSLFSAVLIIGMQWSVQESPLFSIYFSWAFIPLFQRGIQFLIEKFKWKEKTVYYLILIIMLLINVTTLYDIDKYLS